MNNTSEMVDLEPMKAFTVNELNRTLTRIGKRRPGRGRGIFITDAWPNGLESHPLPTVRSQRTTVATITLISSTMVEGVDIVVYHTEDDTEFGYGLHIITQNILVTCDAKRLVDFYAKAYEDLGQITAAINGLRAICDELKKF